MPRGDHALSVVLHLAMLLAETPSWELLPTPELSTVRFTWVPGDAECPAPETFQDFFIVPLTLMADQLPATYCIYGLDQAGNATDVVRIPLDG